MGAAGGEELGVEAADLGVVGVGEYGRHSAVGGRGGDEDGRQGGTDLGVEIVGMAVADGAEAMAEVALGGDEEGFGNDAAAI